MADTPNAAAIALPIGGLSKRTGCNIETIRYYERIGLMPAPPRTPAGRRVYDDDHVRHLTFIRRSRELGFTLEEVRGLLRLVEGGHYTCEEVKAITVAHLADTKRKIADLRRLARVLEQMAAECEGGAIPECPIVDALRSGK